MSRPQFFADHNFHGEIVDGLIRRDPSFPITTALDMEMEEATDQDILEHAAKGGEIVLSHDRNSMIGFAYERIRAGNPMPGLFMVDADPPIGRIIEDLFIIWLCSEAEEWHNQVTYLPLKKPIQP